MRLLKRLLRRVLVLGLGIFTVWLIAFVFRFTDSRLPTVLALAITYGVSAYIVLPRIVRMGLKALQRKRVPRFTITGDGLPGDPVNLVLTGTLQQLNAAFGRKPTHPGGNITGFALFEFAVGAKWLELLKQIAPSVTRAAVIYEPATPSATGFLPLIQAAGRSSGVDVDVHSVYDTGEIEGVINALAKEPNAGLIAIASPVVTERREFIVSLANRSRLPTIFALRYFAEAGGLASYGIDNLDLYRRAGSYVDRVLKGEKPSDLPVQQATKFQLVINLKTAKALGLTVPSALLAAADEVIE